MKQNEYRNYRNYIAHKTATISKTAIVGRKFRPMLQGWYNPRGKTQLESDVYIGEYVVIGKNTTIGKASIVDDFSKIECEVTIGSSTLIIYRSIICNEVKIGNNCVIGGFVGEQVKIGDCCRIFGKIVHRFDYNYEGWDDDNATVAGASIGNNVVIGCGSLVIGDISIGNRIFIMPNTIVTKDIKDDFIVKEIDKQIHISEYRGKLRESAFWRR